MGGFALIQMDIFVGGFEVYQPLSHVSKQLWHGGKMFLLDGWRQVDERLYA